MSYYRKSYYRKSSYRRPLYKPAPQKENTFNIYEYLRKEFLNADNETFQQIALFYRDHYGNSAYSYMLKVYKSWKTGSVSLSSLTMGRILECVPKFLSPEKRLFILRCEIHNFFEKAKLKLSGKDHNLSDLNEAYKTLQSEIINFNQTNLHWFIGKNIFPLDQIEHYLNVCKYALNERLKQSYKQVINDLNIISNKICSFSGEIALVNYKIDLLNLTFDIMQIRKTNVSYFPLYSLAINLDNSFLKYGEKYILDELMKMSFYEKEGAVNAFLNSQDIDVVFSHFNKLTKEKNEIVMTSILQGEGGLLTIRLEYIPVKKSVESVIIASLKIVSIVFGLISASILVIVFKFYWILNVVLLGGFILIFYLLSIIPEEITKIRKSIIQIKRYGKQ